MCFCSIFIQIEELTNLCLDESKVTEWLFCLCVFRYIMYVYNFIMGQFYFSFFPLKILTFLTFSWFLIDKLEDPCSCSFYHIVVTNYARKIVSFLPINDSILPFWFFLGLAVYLRWLMHNISCKKKKEQILRRKINCHCVIFCLLYHCLCCIIFSWGEKRVVPFCLFECQRNSLVSF